MSITYQDKLYVNKIKKSDIGFRTIKLLEEKKLIDNKMFQFLREDKSCSFQLLKLKEEMTEMEIKYRKYRVKLEPELYFENKGYYVARNWGIGNIDKFISRITEKFPELSYKIN